MIIVFIILSNNYILLIFLISYWTVEEEQSHGDHIFIYLQIYFHFQSKKISMQYFIYLQVHIVVPFIFCFSLFDHMMCLYVACMHINRFEMPVLKSDFKSYSFRSIP